MTTAAARREIDAALEAIAQRAEDEAEAGRQQARTAHTREGREVARAQTAAWQTVSRWIRHAAGSVTRT